MMIIQGTADTLVPPDQAEELAADLTAAGDPDKLVLVPGAGHGFEFRPEGQKMVPEILAFLARSWNDKGSTF
jgi:dipeptidyl aminopeptidase/acylaminoacyl peptidase